MSSNTIPLRLVEGDPIMDKMPTLRERFKWQASALWAKGQAPTAEEIADAMMKVVTDKVDRQKDDSNNIPARGHKRGVSRS